MKKKAQKHLKEPAPKVKKRHYGDSVLMAVLVVLLAVAAIATGIALPGLASELQSRKVDSFHMQEELGAGMLCLTGDDRKLEKLKAVSRMNENSMIEIEEGRFSSAQNADAAINELLRVLNEAGIPLGEGRHWEILDTQAYLLLPDEENPESNLVWRVEAEDGKNNRLIYCTDDATGFILGVYAEGLEYRLDEQQTAERFCDGIREYYDFTDVDVSSHIVIRDANTDFLDLQLVFELAEEELMRINVHMSDVFIFNS